MASLLAMSLIGCGQDESDAEQVALLEKRLDVLERELDAVRSKTESPVASDQVSNLERRINEIENARGQTQAGMAQEFQKQDERLQRMFRGFNQMQEVIQTGQTWAVFGLGYQGHTVARTRHGSFLIELQSQEPDPKGYRLTLRIGNPTGLHVHQFKIYGDYGNPPPEVPENATYDTYVRSIDQWEGSLKTFEATFVTSLPPNEWTVVGLVIPATRLAELQFVRFRMEIERTGLDQSSEASKLAQFGIHEKGATMLETRHGMFLVTVQRHRKAGSGYEIDLLIGNPLGMTVTSSRLVGDFGIKAPKMSTGDSGDEYSHALTAWDQSLKPFDARISESLIPFHWNPVTIKVPASREEDLEFIRARLEVQNVSLRNPD